MAGDRPQPGMPERTGGGWHFSRRKGVKAGQGKTKLVLALSAPLIAQLRAHRRQQAAERLTAGAPWQDWDLVFCTPDGTPVDSRDDWQTGGHSSRGPESGTPGYTTPAIQPQINGCAARDLNPEPAD
jgi:hypothetical protein